MAKVKLVAREDVKISLKERGWFEVKQGQVFYGESFGGITVVTFEDENNCEYSILKTSEAEEFFDITEEGEIYG